MVPEYPTLETLWYENEAGEKWFPDLEKDLPQPPPGFIYQHARFPLELHHSVNMEDTGQVCDGTSTYAEDLATVLVTVGGFPLSQAILLSATACEKCMNVMAHDWGLKWGYASDSEDARKCGTECELCNEWHPTTKKA